MQNSYRKKTLRPTGKVLPLARYREIGMGDFMLRKLGKATLKEFEDYYMDYTGGVEGGRFILLRTHTKRNVKSAGMSGVAVYADVATSYEDALELCNNWIKKEGTHEPKS